MSGLSIVIPIFNEKKNLFKLSDLIYRFVKNKNFELIYVDDNSADGTLNVLRKLKKKYKTLKFYIRKKKPRDLSKSCIMGFEKAQYSNILVMDGDLQHRPSGINKLYSNLIKHDCDIVIGSRELTHKRNEGLKIHRLISSIILIYIVNLLLGFKTNDPMSRFFVFNKKIYADVKKKLSSRGYKILLDLIYSQNKKIKIKDVFIKFKSREEGLSKMDLRIIYLLIKDIIKKLLKFR